VGSVGYLQPLKPHGQSDGLWVKYILCYSFPASKSFFCASRCLERCPSLGADFSSIALPRIQAPRTAEACRLANITPAFSKTSIPTIPSRRLQSVLHVRRSPVLGANGTPAARPGELQMNPLLPLRRKLRSQPPNRSTESFPSGIKLLYDSGNSIVE
jgi:hypothetical protein